jgi:tetratricopeptide (TPR) repeat protein
MALAAAHPDDPDTQRSLASGHLQVGAMHLEARRLAQAEQSFRDTLVIQERLAAEQPRAIDLQRDLAATYLNLGVVSTRSGDLAKARTAYGSARTIWQKLVDENPSVTAYSYYLCLLDNDLGLVHQMTGDPEQATAAFSQSLERSKKLTHDHPRVVVFFTVRAMAEYNLGNLSRDIDRLTAALDWYATAERTVTEVLRQEPHHVEAVMVLWSIYGARAVALDQAGRHREALEDWDRCANDEKSFMHHLLRFGRAMSLADRDRQPLGAAALADHVRVTAEAQMFVEQFSPPSGILYILARALTLCRQGAAQDRGRTSEERDRLVDTYAVRAVELLVRARTAGYFRYPKNRERLLHEKDFDPLRLRPDFQKLLDGL